jgi:D-alanyl-D-alanine carboxypeptidase (penicillin-binding protein 5/6)
VLKPIWPAYGSGAVGATGYDGVLAKYGDQSARPIASLTKIITALLVLQKKPLDGESNGPDIVFTQSDQDIYNQEVAAGAAVKPVSVGGSMTERQALETMLLPSAANYSITLANWAYGSMNAYLNAANAWLANHNLAQTRVVDTSGLLPGSVSSPSDLITIGKLALANPTLASIVAMKQATVPDVGTITNGNSLLGKDGINGIKTGTTSEAGATILFSSVVTVGNKQVTIVGDLLGAGDRGQQNSDVVKLLDSIRPAFLTP